MEKWVEIRKSADFMKMAADYGISPIVARILRQDTTSESMSQFSQSAMGYTVSGSPAVVGGGVANAILRNDLKRLGIKTQRLRGISLI